MATLNGLYSFTPSTAAKASEVNANFNTVKSFVDGITTGANIDSSAITEAKINNGAVSEVKIANTAVTADKLATNAVTTDKVNALAVTEAKIADTAVTTVKIADNAITNAKIADNAVGTLEIADNAVTNAKLPANSFAVTYQDFTLTGVTNVYGFYTTEQIVTLTGGKLYTDVIGVVCLGGVNAYGMGATITGLGVQSGVFNNNQIKISANISNIVAGTTATVRVWLK